MFLRAYGTQRMLRVGGLINARYDADLERLVLGEGQSEGWTADIPYNLAQTRLMRGESRACLETLVA